MAMYIKGMGNVSPQKTWDDENVLAQAFDYRGNLLSALEPDYTPLIDAKSLRRMSRIIKMGVAAAKMALQEAKLQQVDGIITGTAYGCIEDTTTFLTKMIELNEQALNPTPFIQSTHNTIGSQIALLLQCPAYNQTFTQRAFSFEHALLDGFMQLVEAPEKNLLIGGIDEVTPTSHAILSRFGIFRKKLASTLNLFNLPKKGTVDGEGAAYFVVNGIKDKTSLASIVSISMLYKPDAQKLRDGIEVFIRDADLRPSEVDLVLIGKSGDKQSDLATDALCKSILPNSGIGFYKHMSGEYPTAAAFAVWLGARILVEHHIPEVVVYKHTGKQLRNVLIYNPYFGTHHSLILLRSCRDTI